MKPRLRSMQWRSDWRWKVFTLAGAAFFSIGLPAQADDQPVRAVSPYSSDYTSIQRYYSGSAPTYQLNLPGQVILPGQMAVPGQVIVPDQSSIILTQPIYPIYPRPLPIYPRRSKVGPYPRYPHPQQRFSSPQQGITFPSAIIQTPNYLYIGPKYPNSYYQPYPQRPFPKQGQTFPAIRYPLNPGRTQACWYASCYPQSPGKH